MTASHLPAFCIISQSCESRDGVSLGYNVAMKTLRSGILFLILFLLVSHLCLAETVRVTEVQGSAWASSQPGGVKRSLTAGDLLRKDDLIEVALRGSVRLQQGPDSSNYLYIEGPSKIRVQALSGSYYVEKGKLVALLDALPADRVFQIETVCAVASVRGTRFWVDYSGSTMETAVFSGTVQVTPGNVEAPAAQSIWVHAGEKLSVNSGFETMSEMLSTSEKEEFMRILNLFQTPTVLSSVTEAGVSKSDTADDVYEVSDDDIIVSAELTL